MAERQAYGIDINEYSRTCGVNYELVKAHLMAGDYDFILIKAGLGTLKSKLLEEQKQNVELNNIPYATYHFLDPRDDMKDQARKYVDWVGTQQPFYIIDIESPQYGVRVANKAEVQTNIDELERLTQKQPVLYSSKQILKHIDFMHEASQFRLWIAQYPYDATRPSKKVQYRYFNDFAIRYAGTLPSTVIGTELEQNTILWQFSSKGDGPYYVYNLTTADPKFIGGMKEADMNVSIKSCSEFMKEMFGVTTQGGGGIEHLTEEPPYPGLTNQIMINAIYAAAKPFTSNPWQDWIVRAGLEYLAVPNTNRNKRYTGPKVEDLPNLTEQEKAAILAAIQAG